VNDTLVQLLASAGLDADMLARDWSRVVLVQNNGRVPRFCARAADAAPCAQDTRSTHDDDAALGSRGFNLLILGDDGRPSHFCKCRGPGDGMLAHEADTLAVLGAEASLRDVVPTAALATSETMSLLATGYALGTPFSHIAARAPERAWLASVDAILDTTEQLGTCIAARQMLSGAAHACGEVRRTSLGVLGAAGVAQDELAVLERAMVDGEDAAPLPQHGDLWPANVLRDGHHWRVLDFEVFGEVRVPLFDALHLVRTSAELRRNGPGEGGAWVDWLFGAATHEADAARALLGRRAARHGLSAREANGALAFYVVAFAARALTQESWGSTPAQWPRDVARVATLLDGDGARAVFSL
jgi:hypothetical protein